MPPVLQVIPAGCSPLVFSPWLLIEEEGHELDPFRTVQGTQVSRARKMDGLGIICHILQ